MRDIPIIFSTPMVRALLDGRKTMTRRLAWKRIKRGGSEGALIYTQRNKVQPGDRLWVRERWGCPPADHPRVKDGRKPQRGDRVVFMADPADAWQWRGGHGCADFVWRPSIRMPRWASRLTLVVTATKVERLQDISERDAIAEGIEWYDCCWGIWNNNGTMRCGGSPDEAFRCLWVNLHGTDAWYSNPEVVALTFTVHRCNIDAMPKEAA